MQAMVLFGTVEVLIIVLVTVAVTFVTARRSKR